MKKHQRLLAFFLCVLLISSTMPLEGVMEAEAARRPRLVKKSAKIYVGKKIKIRVKGKPAGAKITYKSRNKRVAKVNKKGTVKGIRAGKAVIKVIIKLHKRKIKTLKFKVTVKKKKRSSYVYPTTTKKPIVTKKPSTASPSAISAMPSTSPAVTLSVLFDSAGGTSIDRQSVLFGDKAAQPEDPEKDHCIFMGWYPQSDGFSYAYNFDTPIIENTTLYAKWYDETDTKDSDNDGITDELERSFGSNPEKSDSNGDGLSDYDELNWLNYNPLLTDSDGNGIPDTEEDPDGDSLTNIEESSLGTNMIVADTDNDGLSDYDEAKVHNTDPLKVDTDGDGVEDGVEIEIGSDPLKEETEFSTTVNYTNSTENKDEEVGISVTMQSSSEAAGTLSIMPIDGIDDPLISSSIPGYLDSAYEIHSDDKFQSATITFTYGDEVGTLGEDFQPRIYYYNEAEGTLEEVDDQVVKDGVVQADVTHFSKYILLNKVDFDSVWDDEIKPPVFEDENVDSTNLDIAFVLDYSMSMIDNDGSQLFKEVSKKFVDKLRDDIDQAAVIKFIKKADVVSPLTTDKDKLYNAIDSIEYDDGYGTYSGTNGSAGLNSALDLLESSDSKHQFIILITDGEDTMTSYTYDSLIDRANENNVIIYTIGMGTASEEILKKIASQTKGTYYHATTSADSLDLLDLSDVFEDIETSTIDMTTDSNNDGISDYYTELLNNGTLRISNGSSWLVGVTDMYGDSDDWDGDGLKNGEELSVITNGDGKVYCSMESDPLLYDTDFDGYNDYNELRKMKTSPWKITLSTIDQADWTGQSALSGKKAVSGQSHLGNRKSAATVWTDLDDNLEKLTDDTNFPEEYLDFSKEDHWMQYIFDYSKTEQAKDALIDYFYTYTTEKEISRYNNSAERLATKERLTNLIGAVSDVIGCVKSVRECTETIGTMGYSDKKIEDSVKQANKTAKSAEDISLKLTLAKKLDVDKLNEWMKQKNPTLNSFLQIGSGEGEKKFSESASMLKEVESGLDDLIENVSQLNKIDWENVADGAISLVSKTAKIGTAVATLAKGGAEIIKKVTTADKKVAEWPIKIRWTAKRDAAVYRKSNVGKAVGITLTVGLDVLETVGDVCEVASTYGKIEANYAEFQKYLDLISYIENNDQAPKYIRYGAQDITKLFDDSGDPDWKKFDSEVRKQKGKKIAAGAFNLIVDVAGYAFPVVKLVNTVYKVAKATFTLVGATRKARAIIEIQLYYRITDGSIALLLDYAQFNNTILEYSPEDADAYKYVIQLVQSRIVGLNSTMDYLNNGRVAGLIDRGWFSEHKSKDDVTLEYSNAIEEIYDIVKSHALSISKNLPLYANYMS